MVRDIFENLLSNIVHKKDNEMINRRIRIDLSENKNEIQISKISESECFEYCEGKLIRKGWFSTSFSLKVIVGGY